jgi:hypothetical protein
MYLTLVPYLDLIDSPNLIKINIIFKIFSITSIPPSRPLYYLPKFSHRTTKPTGAYSERRIFNQIPSWMNTEWPQKTWLPLRSVHRRQASHHPSQVLLGWKTCLQPALLARTRQIDVLSFKSRDSCSCPRRNSLNQLLTCRPRLSQVGASESSP